MTRFFVSPEEYEQQTVTLTGENAQHAAVLRLKEGETVVACDGAGREALCSVSRCANKFTDLEVKERRESTAEAAVRVSVYMAFAKSDKLEHVIQKATELGAYEIVAFPSARCVSRPDEKSLKKKVERWQKIAAPYSPVHRRTADTLEFYRNVRTSDSVFYGINEKIHKLKNLLRWLDGVAAVHLRIVRQKISNVST